MLHTAKPREQSGRDTFARYRSQIRSTAIQALKILESKDVDKVYCDLHDDIVIRLKKNDSHVYVFIQVKTKNKQNYNWNTNDLLNIPSTAKNLESHILKVKDSFLGKLILHTIVFDKYCMRIVFQTNINNADSIDDLVEDLEAKKFDNKYSKFLLENFNDIFLSKDEAKLEENEIKEKLLKLHFETDVQYIKSGDENFEPLIRHEIYKYSEIDLQQNEIKQILINFLELISKRTENIISDWTPENIESMASIDIEDLLDILSISKDAYYSLVNGEPEKAVKHASIIQRMLMNSSADDSLIKMCSDFKINWDIWIRDNRHNFSEMDYMTIIDLTREAIKKQLQGDSFGFSNLRAVAKGILSELDAQEFEWNLTEELVLGSIFSEFVKGKTWS